MGELCTCSARIGSGGAEKWTSVRPWLQSVETRVESAWSQRLKPKYDRLLSSLTFKLVFNSAYLRLYKLAQSTLRRVLRDGGLSPRGVPLVGRCRLTR
jgi:hypothetical protein